MSTDEARARLALAGIDLPEGKTSWLCPRCGKRHAISSGAGEKHLVIIERELAVKATNERITSTGTFSDDLTAEGSDAFKGLGDEPVQVTLYGPAKFRWPKRWYYRIAGRLFDTPWPEAVISSGPAYVDYTVSEANEDETVVTGTFKRAGKWTIEDDE